MTQFFDKNRTMYLQKTTLCQHVTSYQCVARSHIFNIRSIIRLNFNGKPIENMTQTQNSCKGVQSVHAT